MLSRFTIISGLGWLMDLGIFWLLAGFGLAPFWANIVGATCAVLFVFFSSLRPIFLYVGDQTHTKLAQYLAYQLIAIPAASWAIGSLHSVLAPASPIWAKILVTPVTFICNFLFMKHISQNQTT